MNSSSHNSFAFDPDGNSQPPSNSLSEENHFSDDHVWGPPTMSCRTDSSFQIRVRNDYNDLAAIHQFNHRFVLIGRSPDCDLVLRDQDVSYRHAYIQEIFGRYICVDLASQSGCYWPEGRRQYGWFDQSPIRIGSYQLELIPPDCEREDEDDSRLLEQPDFDPESFFHHVPEDSTLPRVHLRFLNGHHQNEEQTIRRPITLVGWSSSCKLRLKHQSVSRVHCSLNLRTDGLWVVDLLGKKGTLVDGELVRSQRLHEGAVLKIGKYEFQVQYESSDSELSTTDKIADLKPQGVVSEKMVGRLLDQISDMQQQFLQQSQEQTRMMLEFFGTMQTNQLSLLRDEMDRVHQIDQEMRDLRILLEKSQIRHEQSDAAAGYQPQSHPPAVKSSDTKQRNINQADRSAAMFDEKNSLTESPSSQNLPDEVNASRKTNKSAANNSVSETAAPVETEPASSAENDTVRRTTQSEINDHEKQSEPLADESHHTAVLQRMFQLEKEKESIMKKMMRSVFS